MLHPQKLELVKARKLVVCNYVANLAFWLRFASSKNYTKDHPVFTTLLDSKSRVERLNKAYPGLSDELDMLLDSVEPEEEEDNEDMDAGMEMDEEEEDEEEDDDDDALEISEGEEYDLGMDKMEDAVMPCSKSSSIKPVSEASSSSSSSKQSKNEKSCGALSLKDKVMRMRQRTADEEANAKAEASERKESEATNTFLQMMQARKM